MSMKMTVIILLVVVFLQAAACTFLWFRCESRQRFTYIGTTALGNYVMYVMFDSKTAQACWAGPPGPYTIVSPDGKHVKETNGANIPFCKDLK
jgi:hypothetical protein